MQFQFIYTDIKMALLPFSGRPLKKPNQAPDDAMNEQVTHQVPQVIHAKLVAMEPHGGLQVVHVDEPQILLPQFPAFQLLTLGAEGKDGVTPS